MSDRGLASTLVVFFFIPTCALQLSGIFSSRWVKIPATNATRECYVGVIFNDNCWSWDYPRVIDLGGTVRGLEIITAIIMAFTTLNALCSLRYSDDEDEQSSSCCRLCTGCVSIFYPFSGILGFAGCMILVSEGLAPFYWAFYVCLAASIYNILQMFFCCWFIYQARHMEDEGSGEEEPTGVIVMQQLQITQVTHNIFHIT